MMSPLHLPRLSTWGAGCLLELGCVGDIGQGVNIGKDWSQLTIGCVDFVRSEE